MLLLKSPTYWRAVRARAIRFGDEDRAAEASLGLRASKLAKHIEAAVDGPPLPPELVEQLHDLLLLRREPA